MFHSARLKLTAWYLLIIMLISLTFSLVIFRFLSEEIERFDRVQRIRMERQLRSGMPGIVMPPSLLVSPEIVEETKQRVIFSLAFINGGIFAIAGALGYFLAGRTLKPIKDMVDVQNRFISDASHEFRTPLTSLKSAFEVYLRSKNPSLEESETIITESVEEVNRLQYLSDSLLNLSQYQKGLQTDNFTQINIKDVLQKSIKHVSTLAKEKEIKIESHTTSQLIRANKNSLEQLFIILLDNAIKYSSEKSKVIVKTEKSRTNFDIHIIDSGIGIDHKDIPHIFDRFFRANSARSKSKSGGYGLGLSIAKKIIDIHSGNIEVKSALNKGTTFTVSLPLNAK